jgi:hypothetical protein
VQYGHSNPSALAQNGIAWEEGGSVPIRSDTEQHEIESGNGRIIGRGEVTNRPRIARRGCRGWTYLSFHPMYLTRSHRNAGKKRVARHPIVAFSAAGRDAPLIAEEDLRGSPRQVLPVPSGEKPVQALGSSSPRKYEGEDPAVFDGLLRGGGDVASESGGLRRKVRKDPELGPQSANHRCPHCSTSVWASEGPSEPAG